MELYIITGIMLLFCITLILLVAKFSSLKAFMYKRDLLYTQRFDILEQAVKEDIRSILEILKNKA